MPAGEDGEAPNPNRWEIRGVLLQLRGLLPQDRVLLRYQDDPTLWRLWTVLRGLGVARGTGGTLVERVEVASPGGAIYGMVAWPDPLCEATGVAGRSRFPFRRRAAGSSSSEGPRDQGVDCMVQRVCLCTHSPFGGPDPEELQHLVAPG